MSVTDPSPSVARPDSAVMRGVIPYLNLAGRAGEAADFYMRAFAAADLGRVPHADRPGRYMHVQLAINGEGVALGSLALIADDLAAGRLVCPFDTPLATGAAYYVVYPQGALNDPKVRAFRDWLMEEAELGRGAGASAQAPK